MNGLIQDINKAIKVVDEQILQIIQVDSNMNTIYQMFGQKTNEEKEQCLDEYIKLFNKRLALTLPLNQVKLYLSGIIDGLSKHELSFWDKIVHKKRINKMKAQVELAVSFIDESVEQDVVNTEITIQNEDVMPMHEIIQPTQEIIDAIKEIKQEKEKERNKVKA